MTDTPKARRSRRSRMRRADRRSRSKARKPKYLSLRRYLTPLPPPTLAASSSSPPPPTPPPPEERSSSSSSASPSTPSSDMSSSSSSASPAAAPAPAADAHRHEQQSVDLVPLYSDHLDRDSQVACLLLLDDDPAAAAAAGVGGEEPPTLDALLGDSGAATESSGSPPSLTSSSMNQDGGCGADGDGLARRALRGRERWVYYRSSSAGGGGAASSPSEEEASSRGVDLWWRCTATAVPALALKLDYEEILTAWSDRGSLYIDGDDRAQVVPQLNQIADPYYSTSAFFPIMVEVGGGACKVPESRGESAAPTKVNVSDRAEVAAPEISREARVRRYKEKRQRRLFAKRIRYEVRKINAEKRPRWKGRFIKRMGEKDEEALDSNE